MDKTTLYFSAHKDCLPDILKSVSAFYEAYTLIETKGCWKGVLEDAYKLEIIGDIDVLKPIYTIAEEIKEIAKQESVLITFEEMLDVNFI